MTCSPNPFDAQQKRNSREARLFPQSWVWFFRFQNVSFFRPNDATFDAHHATSVLNQNNHTTFNKLSRYVLVTRVTILSYSRITTLSHYTRRNQREFWCFVFPWHGIVVLYLREVRRKVGFVSCESLIVSLIEYALGGRVAGGVWEYIIDSFTFLVLAD